MRLAVSAGGRGHVGWRVWGPFLPGGGGLGMPALSQRSFGMFAPGGVWVEVSEVSGGSRLVVGVC